MIPDDAIIEKIENGRGDFVKKNLDLEEMSSQWGDTFTQKVLPVLTQLDSNKTDCTKNSGSIINEVFPTLFDAFTYTAQSFFFSGG